MPNNVFSFPFECKTFTSWRSFYLFVYLSPLESWSCFKVFYFGPSVWNWVPQHIRNAATLNAFRSVQKTPLQFVSVREYQNWHRLKRRVFGPDLKAMTHFKCAVWFDYVCVMCVLVCASLLPIIIKQGSWQIGGQFYRSRDPQTLRRASVPERPPASRNCS